MITALRAARDHRVRAVPHDRGASAVEFALVAPLLIILVFGIIAFGVVLAQQLTIGNAARQAARYVVTQDRTCEQAMQQIQQSATTIGMSPANVDVTISVNGSAVCGPAQATFSNADQGKKPCVGTSVGDAVTVEARYRTTLIIPLVVADNSFDLSSEGIFRCEYR